MFVVTLCNTLQILSDVCGNTVQILYEPGNTVQILPEPESRELTMSSVASPRRPRMRYKTGIGSPWHVQRTHLIEQIHSNMTS